MQKGRSSRVMNIITKDLTRFSLSRSLSAICFAVLLLGISCDTEEGVTVPVTGIILSDDGTPISDLRVRFYDHNVYDYLPNYCETDIYGVFTTRIPRRFEMIEAQSYLFTLDSAYHSAYYRWVMKVDPEMTPTIVIPWRSEIVFNFAPKEPSVSQTRCRIRMEYKFSLGGDSDSEAWRVQELEFDSDTIVTEGKRMFIPRNREVQLQITKYTPKNLSVISQLDTVFIPTSRKNYMMLRW